MAEAALLMDNAKHLRQVFGLTLVTSVLVVLKVSGGDFSTFWVFLPVFLSAAYLLFGLSFLVCYGSRRARQEEEERRHEDGFNTDV